MPASDLRSTARPSPLRLFGFVAVAVGAVAAGLGATREWAAVGFPQDELRAVDVSFRGTDVWEGKVVLFGALLALIALLAMRLSTSRSTRRALAVGVTVIGLVAAAVALLDALRADDRFGGGAGIDRLAAEIAEAVGQPEDVVRDQLREQFEADLRVDTGPGVWLSVGGGVLLAVGGVLSLAWANRRPTSAFEADDAVAAEPPPPDLRDG